MSNIKYLTVAEVKKCVPDFQLKTNDQVDHEILALIERGKASFVEIWMGVYSNEFWHAQKTATVPDHARHWNVSSPFFRHVDRRLQTLRMKGLITYAKKQWVKGPTL